MSNYIPIPSQMTQEVIVDEDLRINIHGYRLSSFKRALYHVFSIATFGLIYLIGKWFPRIVLWFNYDPCSFEEATHVFVENQWAEGLIISIQSVLFDGNNREAFHKIPELCSSHLKYVRCFQYRYIKFKFNPVLGQFVPNDIWRDYNWTSVHSAMEGIETPEIITRRKAIFDDNKIVIEEKSTFRLLMDEVLHPFFIFQIASMVLWSLDNYYYYATCIFLISAVSVIATLIETKQNIRKLRDFGKYSCSVRVFRCGDWQTVDSTDLVPGDVFEITSGFMPDFPVDAVLLLGDCIVNESMLTGESVPISKSPISDAELLSLDFEKEDPASISSMSRFFLFAGTKVIRSRSNAKIATPSSSIIGIDSFMNSEQLHSGAVAMAVRIGFNTTKGNLIRTMLFPKPNKFKFYRDSFRFIAVLSLLASVGFCASFYNFFLLGESWSNIFVRALDLITIVVPPALPATMAIGTSFAISRLKKSRIFCISPPRVNICGKLDLMCFDKTGTLTEEGLDVLGFRFTVPLAGKDLESPELEMEGSDQSLADTPCRFSMLYSSILSVIPRPIAGAHLLNHQDSFTFSSPKSGISLAYPTLKNHPNAEVDFPYPLITVAMATCHSIKVVNNELVGDPMDLKMFKFTGWEINEGCPGVIQTLTIIKPSIPNTSKLGIVKSFDFVSTLRRMGVIVRRFKGGADIDLEKDGNFEVFVKGAPEAISKLCKPSSIPSDYEEQLNFYAHHGYRVLAVAHRQLRIHSPLGIRQSKRSDVEKDLKFLGFIIFENKLKPGTTAVVRELHQAKIRQVVVTGDNVLTSISVSQECELVGPNTRIYVPRFLNGSPIVLDSTVIWENVTGLPLRVDSKTFQEMTVCDPSESLDIVKTLSEDRHNYCLAITGDVFAWMLDFASDDAVDRMLLKTQIFARMSPDQKHFLVERFQDLGYCVGFTGDGSNDCGALKNADVGLSLSEEEASVAAPFTSQSKDLSCVLRIITEGRAALVTSFCCFKYMALYSLIQFTTVSLLYSQGNNLGDAQYLYIDIFIIIPIAIFMGQSGPRNTLCPKRPTASLVSKPVLTSLFGQVLIQVFFQFLAFYWIRNQPWYIPGSKEDPDEPYFQSLENSILFYFGTFQYMIVALVYNEGAPYRENMINNVPFMLNFFFLWLFTTYILMFSPIGLLELLELKVMNSETQMFIGIGIATNLILSWVCEAWLFKRLAKWIDKFIWRLKAIPEEALLSGDRSRLAKRAKWKERGKLFKLVRDDLEADPSAFTHV